VVDDRGNHLGSIRRSNDSKSYRIFGYQALSRQQRRTHSRKAKAVAKVWGVVVTVAKQIQVRMEGVIGTDVQSFFTKNHNWFSDIMWLIPPYQEQQKSADSVAKYI
jgi:hypothetical protein